MIFSGDEKPGDASTLQDALNLLQVELQMQRSQRVKDALHGRVHYNATRRHSHLSQKTSRSDNSSGSNRRSQTPETLTIAGQYDSIPQQPRMQLTTMRSNNNASIRGRPYLPVVSGAGSGHAEGTSPATPTTFHDDAISSGLGHTKGTSPATSIALHSDVISSAISSGRLATANDGDGTLQLASSALLTMKNSFSGQKGFAGSVVVLGLLAVVVAFLACFLIREHEHHQYCMERWHSHGQQVDD